MISHERATMLAALDIDFRLGPADRVELQQHLASCGACRMFAAGARSDAAALRMIGREEAPPRVGDSVAAALLGAPASQRRSGVLGAAWLVLVLGLLVAALLAALYVAGSRNSRLAIEPRPGLTAGAQIDAAPAPRIDPPPGPYPAGGQLGMTGALYAADSLWVTTDRAVLRIDPATGRVTATIAVGQHPTRLAFGGGSVWVSVTGDGLVAGLDPATNTVTARYPVGRQPVGLTVAAGSLWVADRLDGALLRVDMTSGEVMRRIDLGSSPLDVDTSAGSIWVTSDRGSGFQSVATLWRVDSDTGQVVAGVPGARSALVAEPGAVWFLAPSTAMAYRVDVGANQVIAQTALHNGASALAYGDGFVWVFSADGFVERIDGATNELEDEVQLGLAGDQQWLPSGVYGGGSGWLWSYDAGRVTRIGPGH